MNKFLSIITLYTLTLLFTGCKNEVNNFKMPTATEPGLLLLNAKFCSFNDVNSVNKNLKIILEKPIENQLTEINTIMKFAGLPQNFNIYRGNIQTALATTVNNQRIVIISNELFSSNTTLDSSYWSSLFIIAHEIGHHLAYNLTDTGNIVQSELDADKFAASVLFRMGADSNQVLTAVASGFISNTKDTETHPSKIKRLEIIKNSWMKAAELRYQAVLPPPVDDNLKVREFTYKNLIVGEDLEEYKVEFEFKPSNRLPSDDSLLTPVLNNFQGIIVNFEPGFHPNFNKFINVESNFLIDVLVTKIDTSYHNIEWLGNPMIVNKVYSLEIRYTPFLKTDKIDDFLSFFVPGRLFEFDVLSSFPNTYGYENYTFISRAKVIYKKTSDYF